MKKLNKLDFLTSLVASFSLVVSGVIGLDIARIIFLSIVPLHARNIHTSSGKALGLLFIWFIFSVFILSAWKGSKLILKFFMRKTNQKFFAETFRVFGILAIFSPVGLLITDTVKKNNLLLDYSAWILTLMVAYLVARLVAYKSSKVKP